jgi:hypothetical protein
MDTARRPDHHNREKIPEISGKTSLVRALTFVDTAFNIGMRVFSGEPAQNRSDAARSFVYARALPQWSVGATAVYVSSVFYVGDESNQLAPIPGYATVNLHTNYKPTSNFEVFASINNLFNKQYSTWGILSDPTGINAPGIPPDGVTNGPGVNNRFLSPAAPIELLPKCVDARPGQFPGGYSPKQE